MGGRVDLLISNVTAVAKRWTIIVLSICLVQFSKLALGSILLERVPPRGMVFEVGWPVTFLVALNPRLYASYPFTAGSTVKGRRLVFLPLSQPSLRSMYAWSQIAMETNSCHRDITIVMNGSYLVLKLSLFLLWVSTSRMTSYITSGRCKFHLWMEECFWNDWQFFPLEVSQLTCRNLCVLLPDCNLLILKMWSCDKQLCLITIGCYCFVSSYEQLTNASNCFSKFLNLTFSRHNQRHLLQSPAFVNWPNGILFPVTYEHLNYIL